MMKKVYDVVHEEDMPIVNQAYMDMVEQGFAEEQKSIQTPSGRPNEQGGVCHFSLFVSRSSTGIVLPTLNKF